jgi:hypothetical protein
MSYEGILVWHGWRYAVDWWDACSRGINTLDTAEQVEFLAHIYYNCRVAGGGVNLAPKDLDTVVDMFKTYRKR